MKFIRFLLQIFSLRNSGPFNFGESFHNPVTRFHLQGEKGKLYIRKCFDI